MMGIADPVQGPYQGNNRALEAIQASVGPHFVQQRNRWGTLRGKSSTPSGQPGCHGSRESG